MDTGKLIIKAMELRKLTIEELAAKSGVRASIIVQLMNSNQESSIYAFETVLSSLGYQLTAVESKQ